MQTDDIRVPQHFVGIFHLRDASWQHLVRGRRMVNQNLDLKGSAAATSSNRCLLSPVGRVSNLAA